MVDTFSSTTNLETVAQSSAQMDIHIPPQLKFLMGNIKNIIHTQLMTETHQIWRAQVLKLFSANGFIGKPTTTEAYRCGQKHSNS